MHKGRKRERKNDSQTHKGRKITSSIAISQSTAPIAISRSTVSIAISPSHRSRSCEAPRRSQLRSHKASIAISWSTAPIAAPRWTQSPLSLPSSLNLTGFDDFFFLGFVCVSVLRNEWYYIFVWQPRKCEKMWSDLMIFFLGFVCVSVLRNEWYFTFVWQSRKCEQQVENVFSMVFSRTQLNTIKYFSKHFLKCNQTHENIFLFGK